MEPPYRIDPDPARAGTLPGRFYRDPAAFEDLRDVFARSWQWVGPLSGPGSEPRAEPLTLLPGFLDEPLVLTRDEAGAVRCLSNVCTHRANLVAAEAGPCRALQCRYHGRRFDLAGRLLSMPGFEGVEDFPSERDHLPEVASGLLGDQRFVSLDPGHDFEALVAPVRERVGALPLEEFRHDPSRSRRFQVHAHFALYLDNYLEGFHIPYVHPDLARAVEFDSYSVETFPFASLQRALPKEGEPRFDGPLSAHDGGEAAAAYYFWLYPNTMLNFYPWGLSVNVVLPQALDRTQVLFESYVWRPELLDRGAGGALDKVEREDEEVVECVQRGVRSRLYGRGRYSARHEGGVHHFHRLLGEDLVRVAANGRA